MGNNNITIGCREEDKSITIGFRYVDTFGNEYKQSSTCEVVPDFNTELDIIGYQLDSFLAQCGYLRDGYTTFLTSVTEDEAEELAYHLEQYREEKELSERLNEASDRLDEMSERLDEMSERLDLDDFDV